MFQPQDQLLSSARRTMTLYDERSLRQAIGRKMDMMTGVEHCDVVAQELAPAEKQMPRPH